MRRAVRNLAAFAFAFIGIFAVGLASATNVVCVDLDLQEASGFGVLHDASVWMPVPSHGNWSANGGNASSIEGNWEAVRDWVRSPIVPCPGGGGDEGSGLVPEDPAVLAEAMHALGAPVLSLLLLCMCLGMVIAFVRNHS